MKRVRGRGAGRIPPRSLALLGGGAAHAKVTPVKQDQQNHQIGRRPGARAWQAPNGHKRVLTGINGY